MSTVADRARTLLDLHTAPEILVLTNVWDVISASVVAAVPGVKALATASHSIAATFGYQDGENIPLDLHLDMVRRIAAAVDLPVTMDMEAGYGDPGETTRRAIEAGAVGGNLEDQMRPLDDAVAAVEAVLRAGHDAGIDSCSTPAPTLSSGRRTAGRTTRYWRKPPDAVGRSSRPAPRWCSSPVSRSATTSPTSSRLSARQADPDQRSRRITARSANCRPSASPGSPPVRTPNASHSPPCRMPPPRWSPAACCRPAPAR